MASAFFFDVDGTLIYHDKEHHGTKVGDEISTLPTERVQDAIRELVASGHHAFLATGRGKHSIEQDILDLGFEGIISMNGAKAQIGEHVLLDTSLTPAQVEDLANEVVRLGIAAAFEGPNESILLLPHTLPEGFENPFYESPIAHDFEELLALAPDLNFTKIITMHTQSDIYRQSRYLMDNYTLLDSGVVFHEFVLPGVDKGVALRAIVDALPEKPDAVYAFGDSENDLGMIKAADVGVVMGNSPDYMREAADIVCEGADEDGVARELERLGFISAHGSGA